MAKLVKCEDCGKKVSINAEICPKCGAILNNQERFSREKQKIIAKQEKQARDSERAATILPWIFSVVAIFFALGVLTSSFFAFVLMLVGGLIIMPPLKKKIINKFGTQNKLLNIIAGILIFTGFIIGGTAAQTENEKYLAENPEAAKKLEEKKALKDQEEAEREKEKAQRQLESDRLVACQMEIQSSLKNPKSFDLEYSTIKHAEDPETKEHIVVFKYYATNSFGAEIINTAGCSFDKNGNMTDIGSQYNFIKISY